MSVPNAIYLDCPQCGERSLHEILKGRIGKKKVLEATVKCEECGRVYTTVIREPEEVSVPVIVSDQGESVRTEVELEANDLLMVGDEFFLDETHVIITALEQEGAKRVKRSPADLIKTIWAKKFDKVKVKVSVNNIHHTLSKEILALPDEEFLVGDILRFGREEAVISSIKTKHKMIRYEGAAARDIVRIYAKAMRKTYA
jgi:uncharacterized Zn finger protein